MTGVGVGIIAAHPSAIFSLPDPGSFQDCRAAALILSDASATIGQMQGCSAAADIAVTSISGRTLIYPYPRLTQPMYAQGDITTEAFSPGFSLPALDDPIGPVLFDISIILPDSGSIVIGSEFSVVGSTDTSDNPDTGPVVGADTDFEYIQSSADTVWLVQHNLNRFPNVAACDSTGEQVFGTVFYPDKNQVRIEFSAPLSGFAHLS